jgi:hypothetical protein
LLASYSYTDETPPEVVAFEELFELHDIIERGPNWNSIERIVVTLNITSVLSIGQWLVCVSTRPQ